MDIYVKTYLIIIISFFLVFKHDFIRCVDFTSILKVLADILRALDSGHLAMLTLLDLSAAFDAVDYGTLIRRLEKSYGLRGRAYAGSHIISTEERSPFGVDLADQPHSF